jgi:hypothetical protein
LLRIHLAPSDGKREIVPHGGQPSARVGVDGAERAQLLELFLELEEGEATARLARRREDGLASDEQPESSPRLNEAREARTTQAAEARGEVGGALAGGAMPERIVEEGMQDERGERGRGCAVVVELCER